MAGTDQEEELMQMVRDYIESDSTSFTPSSQRLNSTNPQNSHNTLQEVLSANEAENEVLEKILSYMRDIDTKVRPDVNMSRWVVMRLRADGYVASLCQTSWTNSCKAFHYTDRYEYIDVLLKYGGGDDGKGLYVEVMMEKPARLIVDIDFRSQFELARPTPTYRKLTDTLPEIFVGTEEKLRSIISLLCSAAEESLKENGLHLPPWRKASYTQSKWLSKDCKKIPVPPIKDMNHIWPQK